MDESAPTLTTKEGSVPKQVTNSLAETVKESLNKTLLLKS